SLWGVEHAGPEQVEVCSTVHLAFDELELCDLPLGLSVRPWLDDGGADCHLISCHAPAEAADEALGCRFHPGLEVNGVAAPDQAVKPVNKIARLHQSRNSLLDDGGDRAIGARQQVRAGRKRAGKGPCARPTARAAGRLVAAAPGSPFADDAQRA